MLKLKGNSTAKTVIRIILLIGGVISILGFFLSWTPEGGSPFSHILMDVSRDLRDSIIAFFLLYPHLILGMTVILVAVYSKFKKGTYWIALIASIWSPVVTWHTLMYIAIPTSVLFGEFDVNITLGGYAAIIGPIITLIGLILYKLVK